MYQTLSIRIHPADKVGGRCRARIVSSAPGNHLKQDGQQVDPLLCKAIAGAFFGDYPILFKAHQSVGQYVRRDPFLRPQEISVGRTIREHQVAHDQ